ncbi:MAG: ester cyclase [Mycobacterium sp.]
MTDRRHTIERLLDDYNRHDAVRFASYFAEGGVLRIVATGEVNEGREQIAAGAAERWRAIDYTLQPSGLYECGEDVWVEWIQSGTHVGALMGIPATHRSYEMPGCSHFTFGDDGLLVSDVAYFDIATALRQIGVLPEPPA